MVGGLARAEWRMLVQRSRLPSSVKVTLLAHATLSRHHFHDDLTNQHAITRKRLASAVGKDERSVQRHLRRAEADGWLVRHRDGHNGQQAVFHYVTPARRGACRDSECRSRESSRETDRETERGTALAPYLGRQECLPYVVTYRHCRDGITGAVRSRPNHVLGAGPQTAMTQQMKGWSPSPRGPRECPLSGLASPQSGGTSTRYLSRVRHLRGAAS